MEGEKMGIYVITGGSKGIGEKTVDLLRSHGHKTINIDIDGGDINADLGTPEGRAEAISQVHVLCPDGLDGLVCNHGIAGIPRFKLSYVLSVNYFGAVKIIEGLFDLLKMKSGKCVATVSGAIAYATRGRYYVDELLTNCGDEERICRLVDTFPLCEDGEIIYFSSKIALANWVRRIAPSWAAQGVNVNAVAPGAVATTIMHNFKRPVAESYYYPMPAMFKQGWTMDPADVAQALAFLVMPGAGGISGAILFCDTGSAALINPDKQL